MAKILILEDQIDIAETLKSMLADAGHAVAAEMEPGKVLATIQEFQPDLITLDVSFSQGQDETGISLLKEIRGQYPKNRLPVLVISGTVNADKLTRMMEFDMNGYLGKPVKQGDLLRKITELLETRGPSPKIPTMWEPQMIGNSVPILEMIMEINKAAKAGSDLLITGESGVGKEQVVQKYRELSPRRHKAYTIIDCTIIPTETFESEIFGYVPGAFTGAAKLKRGRIEEAEGGIVFFDEIGDLPENQQKKLLRLLQTKTFMRIGSNEPIRIDAIILAATNKDLKQLMLAGKFRQDLYYRLKYMNIEALPLREHREDIPLLVEHFLRKANHKYRKGVADVEEEILHRFQSLSWPGNIRDLEQCIEYGVIKCEGNRLKWANVEGYFKKRSDTAPEAPAPDINLNQRYHEFKQFLESDREEKERAYYNYHLTRHNYNVTKTAEELGVARAYLNAIIKRLAIKTREDNA